MLNISRCSMHCKTHGKPAAAKPVSEYNTCWLFLQQAHSIWKPKTNIVIWRLRMHACSGAHIGDHDDPPILYILRYYNEVNVAATTTTITNTKTKISCSSSVWSLVSKSHGTTFHQSILLIFHAKFCKQFSNWQWNLYNYFVGTLHILGCSFYTKSYFFF